MRSALFSSGLVALVLAAGAFGCAPSAPTLPGEGSLDGTQALSGPGKKATDARTPELGGNPAQARKSKIPLADAVAQTESSYGSVIEAKFELDDSGALSLSLYPVGNGIWADAERNKFQEVSGDPRKAPFAGGLEVFADEEHLTRSARDLTLVQLSELTVADAIAAMPEGTFPYWSIPTIRDGRAGYGVYYLTKTNKSRYAFVDGGGDLPSGYDVEEIAGGPGDGATDQRVPELGKSLSILRQAQISMGDALDQIKDTNGEAIEAKYEIGDDGKLSLSIYPVKDAKLDAERNHFAELAGDPTVLPWKADLSDFAVPDVEHLTRSARDLTLVQTAALSLRDAVAIGEQAYDGGFVYWAIPTIRGTTSGYGVYVLDAHGHSHYHFVS